MEILAHSASAFDNRTFDTSVCARKGYGNSHFPLPDIYNFRLLALAEDARPIMSVQQTEFLSLKSTHPQEPPTLSLELWLPSLGHQDLSQVQSL